MFVDMCSLLCYIIEDTSKQVRENSVTLTCVLRWYVCVVSEASRSQQQPVSLRYVRRAQPPVVREGGSDFISSSHCNRGQRTLLCILSSHPFWFYQRCIGCFILPQRLGFLHVSINSYTMKTLLFCSSALILSAHRSRSYTGTLWSVSFIDIDFIWWRFLCLGIVLYWFSKGTWFMGALKVDSSNRPTVASARAQLSSLLHWSWFYQQRPRPARDIRALKNFPLRDASGSFLN